MEETVRRLERKRDAARDEAERRRQAVLERILQLEGLATPAGDRDIRALERKLEAVQKTLDELLEEVKLLRAGRKE
jgi:hypothetical protein